MTLVPHAAALAAGAAAALAVLALGRPGSVPKAALILDRRDRVSERTPRRRPPVSLPWLALRLDRSGWPDGPERFLLLAAAMGAALSLVGLAAGVAAGSAGTGAAFALLGAAGGPLLAFQILRAAVRGRRERLLAELAPTLDLVGIELSAGSSPLGALTSVAQRTDGELARLLRSLLAASALGADRSADSRLQEIGERLDLPPLVGLAAVLATSRDYGSAAGAGIRAIALDLRRERRRELIATSRRALSRVLLPAAVGVLLPFMAVLLYPAVSALASSLR